MQTHEILQKYFDRKKKSSQGFSLRSLALQLDVSPSFLSRILSGKKSLPFALLIKMEKALDIESEVFLSLKKAHSLEVEHNQVPLKGRAELESELETWEPAENSKFEILRQWFYIAILDLTSTRDFDGKIETIARRLKISTVSTEVAVRELIANGLLQEIDGRLSKSKMRVRLASQKKLDLIRRFHSQMMDKAQDELKTATDEQEFQKRLITGITLTVPTSKIPEAKMRLAEFIHQLANELTAEEGDEVYHLATQFFPLTKR